MAMAVVVVLIILVKGTRDWAVLIRWYFFTLRVKFLHG